MAFDFMAGPDFLTLDLGIGEKEWVGGKDKSRGIHDPLVAGRSVNLSKKFPVTEGFPNRSMY